MAVAVKLDIQKRDTSKNPRQLRAEGFATGTIYGKGIESISVQFNSSDFSNIYKKSADSNFEVSVDGKNYTVRIAKIQKNYRLNEILNIEFAVV